MGTKNSKFVEVTPQKIPLKCQNLSPAFDKTDRKTHNFSNEVDNDDVGWLRFVSDIDENEIRCEKSFINSVRNS